MGRTREEEGRLGTQESASLSASSSRWLTRSTRKEWRAGRRAGRRWRAATLGPHLPCFAAALPAAAGWGARALLGCTRLRQVCRWGS